MFLTCGSKHLSGAALTYTANVKNRLYLRQPTAPINALSDSNSLKEESWCKRGFEAVIAWEC